MLLIGWTRFSRELEGVRVGHGIHIDHRRAARGSRQCYRPSTGHSDTATPRVGDLIYRTAGSRDGSCLIGSNLHDISSRQSGHRILRRSVTHDGYRLIRGSAHGADFHVW